MWTSISYINTSIMRNYKLILMVVFFFALLPNLNAQSNEPPGLTSYDVLALGESTPSSPEAGKLGEYGQINASPYNGRANISIPIYTINFEGLQIPIELSYDSGGVRVAQESSWAGLNWNLSTNYGISRQIFGSTDFNEFTGYTNGYLFNDITLDVPVNGTYPDRHIYNDILRVHASYNLISSEGDPTQVLDTQPDLFTMNIFGKSYKFILDKSTLNENLIQAKVFSSNNAVITFNLDNFSFTLLDDNGFTYNFNTKEVNTTFASSQGDSSPPSDYDSAISQIFADLNKNNAGLIIAWSLDQVTSPTGRILTFNYEKGLHFTFPQYSFNLDGQDHVGAIASDEQLNLPMAKTNHFAVTTIIENNYLSEISGDFGKVTFNLGNRSDLSTGHTLDVISEGDFGSNVLETPYSTIRSCHGDSNTCGISTDLLPLKLDSITIENSSGQQVVNTQLTQSYFDSDKENDAVPERYLRLKLDEVLVNDKKYSFNYINEDYLPAKDSDGLDFWGFANGVENSNDGTVPRIGRFVTRWFNGFPDGFRRVGQQFIKYQGADRRSRFNHGKTGLLNGIIYPTGGATELIYEPHDVVLAAPRAFNVIDSFSSMERYRWTNLIDESQFNNTYHYLKNAHDPNYNYFEVEDPSSDEMGPSITLDFRLNQIFNVDFPSVANIEAFLRIETGYNGMNFWGGTVLLAIEDVDSGIEQTVFNYNDAIALPGQEPNYVTESIPLTPGNYRLVRKHIYVPEGNYEDYPPTPAISINNPKVLLDTFEALDGDLTAFLERFEVGGARVKQIIHKDVQGNFVRGTAYEYEFPEGFEGLTSSGKLMDELVFYKKTNGFYSYNPRGTKSFILTGNNVVGGQPSAQGGHIGYSYVREYAINSAGENQGWVDRQYHNVPNKYFTQSFSLPYQYDRVEDTGGYSSSTGYVSVQNTKVLGLPLRLSYGYANGNVLEEHLYDINGLLKSRNINEYVYLNGDLALDYFSSFKSYTLYINLSSDPQVNLSIMENNYVTEIGLWGSQDETYFSYQFPLHYGLASKLYSSKTITYEGTPELTAEQITAYDDDTHNPTRSVVLTSKGEESATKYFYAYDEETTGQSGMNDLLAENQITTPVRTDAYLEDILMSSQRTNFTNNSLTDNNTLPISVEALKGIPNSSNNHFEERMEYERFGPYGKISQARNSKGIPITYIWGYNNQYVIAKLENATHGDVENSEANLKTLSNADDDRTKEYLGDEGGLRQALDNLRTSLPNAMVTTYTYDPMIGVTSITDSRGVVSYFDYDSSNRLKSVTDEADNLIQDYDYKFSDVVFDQSFSNSPYVDPEPDMGSGGPVTTTPSLKAMILLGNSEATYQTFKANPSGGDGNYTYKWFIGNGTSKTDFSDSVSGTGETFTLDVACDAIKYVKLEVTSDGDTADAVSKNGNNPCAPGGDPGNHQ